MNTPAGNWRTIAEQARKEIDPEKLLILIHRLCEAADEEHAGPTSLETINSMISSSGSSPMQRAGYPIYAPPTPRSILMESHEANRSCRPERGSFHNGVVLARLPQDAPTSIERKDGVELLVLGSS
jgi:hypothetical protein